MKKIMIVEDDTSISSELKDLLDNAGYNGVVLKDFENSYEEIKKENPDLILLDINIPKLNGEMLLQKIRKESNVPIIMVTSKNTEADEVLSMSYGADDYITKPYNPTILLLRINAIFKRIENKNDVLTYNDLIVDPKKGIVKRDKEELILTKNEMIIFTFLLANIGIVFLIASVAILALKELTESTDNKERYNMLRKLGADEKMINKSLFRQIAIFFIFPLLVAIIHSIFGITFCSYIIETFGNEQLLNSIIMTAIFIVVIYGGYFLITYLCSKNIVKEK